MRFMGQPMTWTVLIATRMAKYTGFETFSSLNVYSTARNGRFVACKVGRKYNSPPKMGLSRTNQIDNHKSRANPRGNLRAKKDQVVRSTIVAKYNKPKDDDGECG